MKTNKDKWFVVSLCGCTDCFVHAIFQERENAVKWAKENGRNPEGYLIDEMTLLELANNVHEDCSCSIGGSC